MAHRGTEPARHVLRRRINLFLLVLNRIRRSKLTVQVTALCVLSSLFAQSVSVRKS